MISEILDVMGRGGEGDRSVEVHEGAHEGYIVLMYIALPHYVPNFDPL